MTNQKTIEERIDDIEDNQFKHAKAIARILILIDELEKKIGNPYDKRDTEKTD